jgi:methylamine utilization protein MauE
MALLPAFLVVAALLVVAGAGKLRSTDGAQAALDAAGIRVPPAAVRLLGAAEVTVGVVAIWAPGTGSALLVALAYAGFAAFTVRLLRVAGGRVDCGCFGVSGSEVGWLHVGLNAAAAAVAAIACLTPPPGAGWILARSPGIAIPLAIGTLGGVYAAYLAFTQLGAAWRSYPAAGES